MCFRFISTSTLAVICVLVLGISASADEPAVPIKGGLKLVSGNQVLAFNANGRLTSVRHSSTGTEFLCAAEGALMFRLTATDAEHKMHVVTAADCRITKRQSDADSVTFRYEGEFPDGAGHLTAELTVRAEGDGSVWTATFETRPDTLKVWEVDYPVLSGLGRPGGDEDGDYLAVPDGWGRRIRRPSAAGRYQGRYASRSATMQFFAYCRNEGTTLHVAAVDGRACRKDLLARPAGDKKSFEMAVHHYPEDMGFRTKYETAYPVLVQCLAGDWYDSARLYRSWATRQWWCDHGKIRFRHDTPKWMRELAVWRSISGKPENALKQAKSALAVAGRPIAVHWYSWHQIPFDNDYPEYFPEKPGVKEAAAELLSMDAWPMVYINGHLWDSDTRSYAQRGGKKTACKKWDGSLYLEHWAKQNHSVPDPSQPVWHEIIMELAEKIFGDLGMKGLYIDQVGACAARLDFDPEHGHPKGGGSWWAEGYDKLLAKLQRRIAEIDPNNILTTEDNAEPYIRGFDGMLMCSNCLPDGLPMFAVVYNDYMALFGRYFYPIEYETKTGFYTKFAEHFVWGAQLAWQMPPEKQEWARKWVAELTHWRRLATEFMAYGEFLRPLELADSVDTIHTKWQRWRTQYDVTIPTVRTGVFRAEDGRVGVVLVNASEKPQTPEFTWPGKPKKIQQVLRDGARVDVKIEDTASLSMEPLSVRLFVLE